MRLRRQGSLARAMRCSVSTSTFAVAEHTSHVVSVAFPEATDDAAEFYRATVTTLGLAGLRTRRAWTMKRDMVSPRATTHWDELAVVSAK